ncbi:MAG: methyltransferase domain-containing protein [Ignavibacteriaceae bacterium]|jgi:ubiquinone/menaquinone biosynthesis C-methylase UbiE|nr:methyltransferase domain-containing protein [Ignavibacteriaceae bacterium]
MKETQNILLPGGFKQFRILKSKYDLSEKDVLIIGSNSEKIAGKMIENEVKSVKIIVSDYDSLMNSRLNLGKDSKAIVKMMDFDNTDFNSEQFNLIYAQASISLTNRNKIVKEIKRILKPEGTFCISEITALQKDYPPFVKNIFDASDILPLLHNACTDYYTERKFSVLYEEDISSSLKSFYENASASLNESINHLTDKEKSYYKKLLNKISHESNAYLKLGADKFIGLKFLLLGLS